MATKKTPWQFTPIGVSKREAAKCERESRDYLRPDGPRAYRLAAVRLTSAQPRCLTGLPKSWEDGDWLRYRDDYRSVVLRAAAYNAKAKKLGWKRWAIICEDREFLKFDEQVEQAQIARDNGCDRPELRLYLGRLIGGEEPFHLSAELSVWMKPTDGENLRERVLMALRKALRQLKSESKKPKPARKPRLHKPGKRGAA
jgi:hypothetical protein